MCMQFVEVYVIGKGMSTKVRCGTKGHNGERVWACGCMVWPEGGGYTGGVVCVNKECCTGKGVKE